MKINKKLILIIISTSIIVSLILVLPLWMLGFISTSYFWINWLISIIRFTFLWFVNIYIINHIKSKLFALILSIVTGIILLLGMDFFIIYFIGNFIPDSLASFSQKMLMRMLYTILFNFLISIILILIKTHEKELNKSKEIADLKFSNLETEYQLIKSQIKPHFIFNTLNIAKSLVKQDPNAAENYIIKLSEFIRSSINYDKKSSTLKDELQICEDFIELQKVRFQDSVNYVVNVEKLYEEYSLPHYSVVELLENAFKHNYFSKKNKLSINIITNDDYLIVSNNSMPKEVENSKHSGLKNLNKRSLLFSGKEIEISNENEIFTVKMKMMKI